MATERKRKESAIIKDIPIEQADVVLLGIPNDMGSSGYLGSADAPERILDALRFCVEERDDYLGMRICDQVNIIERWFAAVRGASPEYMVGVVRNKVNDFLRQKVFVATLGGSHSVSIGAIHSHKNQLGGDFTVVQLDAHLDLRPHDEDFLAGTPDPYAHCCVMRRVHDMKIPFVQAGIRIASDIEMDFLRENDLEKNVFRSGRNDDKCDIIGAISTRKVYLTLDIDVLDKKEIIATGTPENRGWDWNKLYGFLDMLFARKEVIGFDMVEVCPGPDFAQNDGIQACYEAAQLVYWMIGRKFCK